MHSVGKLHPKKSVLGGYWRFGESQAEFSDPGRNGNTDTQRKRSASPILGLSEILQELKCVKEQPVYI